MRRVLSILGATKCNLNCSYCFLHKNPAYVEEDIKLVNVLKDGSYIKNIKKTITKLDIDYKDFDKFEIWGAETSLHIQEAEDFYKELLETFPNLNEFGYSSNFMTDINNHVKLIDLLEEYSPQDEVVLPIQVSVDGPDWISEQTRHYKYQDLKNNVLNFIDIINHKKLKKAKVDLHFKSTLPWDLFEKIFSSRESAEDFYDFWYNEEKDIKDHIISGSLDFNVNNCFVPSLVWPYLYTKEDGLKIVDIARMIDGYEMPKKYGYDSNMVLDMFGFQEVHENYLPPGGCGKYVYSLLIKPDGSMAGCSNGILDTSDKNLEWLKENDYQEYVESLRTRPYSYTHDKDGNVDYDQMLKHHKYMKEFWEYQTNFVLTNLCSQMYEMSYAGLISPIYKQDPEAIYRHALYIMRKHGCYFINLRSNGTPYTPSRSYVSLVCNGLIEYYEQQKRSYNG